MASSPPLNLSTSLGEIVARYGRPGIEQVIERLIEALDAIDGDCDAEDDDPDHSDLDIREGADGIILPTRPLYAIDQSAGPINEIAAHRAYRRAQHAQECRR